MEIETEEDEKLKLKASKPFPYKPEDKEGDDILDIERKQSMESSLSLDAEAVEKQREEQLAEKEIDEKERQKFEVENAPLYFRAMATLIDYGLVYFLVVSYSAVASLIRGIVFSKYSRIDYSNQLHIDGFLIWIAITFFLIFVLPVLFTGNTLGKKILSIQFEDIDGGPSSKLAIIFREILYKPFSMLTVVGLIPVLTDGKHRQGFHDKLANTLVIKK